MPIVSCDFHKGLMSNLMTGFEFTKGTSVGMMKRGALLTEMGRGGKKTKRRGCVGIGQGSGPGVRLGWWEVL